MKYVKVTEFRDGKKTGKVLTFSHELGHVGALELARKTVKDEDQCDTIFMAETIEEN